MGSGAYQFRVSDALEVPLRGYLLRLRLTEGEPDIGALGPGKKITLRAPNGAQRVVTVKDFSLIQGKPSQERFDRTRELDVLIENPDAIIGDEIVDVGWTVAEPT